MNNLSLEQVIELLKNSFNKEHIKERILDKYWLSKNKEYDIPSTGFCYNSSEIIYILFGRSLNWKFMYISEKVWPKEGSHYFLISKNTGEILDITSDQYTLRGLTIPYELAKGRGIRNISNSSKILARLSGIGELI